MRTYTYSEIKALKRHGEWKRIQRQMNTNQVKAAPVIEAAVEQDDEEDSE